MTEVISHMGPRCTRWRSECCLLHSLRRTNVTFGVPLIRFFSFSCSVIDIVICCFDVVQLDC
ncbi:unnamed protein product [Heligmosomoides polygyrus]|uniref:Uncharacterized protein n=1 Tax=Heligmosomoides polygyrus TaxID=6339 RepID=A0A3P7TAL0_HELPZ|nr:unnamed protein product [Heligmosomoides polygyrus]